MDVGCQLIEAGRESVRLYNPEGFDPREYLPADLWRHADSVRYFVHTLHQQRFMYRRDPDDFIEVKAAYMLPFFTGKTAYRPVLDALLGAGVLECDRHYVEGRKSLGYRLGPGWRGVPFRSVRVTNPALVRKVLAKRDEQRGRVTTDVHLYLRGWVERLDFDYEGAVAHAARTGLEGYEPAVEALRDKEWFFTHCDYGRVHHNVSSLKTDFRRFLTCGGRPLVNLDIANSQPLLLSVVLINHFLSGSGLSSLYSWEVENPNLYYEFLPTAFSQQEPSQSHSTQHVPLRLPKLITKGYRADAWKDTTARLTGVGLPEDALLYVELTQRGLLYEHLMAEEGVPPGKRSEFKKSFFGGVLFCQNRPITRQAKLFQAHFPSVYDVVFELKASDYRRLAHVLQRTESSLVINRVARRCMSELPGVCVVTIHDSVLTTPDGAGPVRRIMAEEFGKVGLDPTVRLDDLGREGYQPPGYLDNNPLGLRGQYT